MFSHTWNVKHFSLTQRYDHIRCYHFEPEWTCEEWQCKFTPHSPKFQNYWSLTIGLFNQANWLELVIRLPQHDIHLSFKQIWWEGGRVRVRDYTQVSVFILNFRAISLPMTGGDTLSIFYVSPTRHLKVEVYKKQKNDLINFSSPYNKMKFQMIISFSIGCLSHVDLSKEEYYITIFIQILYYLISCTMLKEIKPNVDLSKEEYYITIFIEVLYYLDYFRYNFMCEFVHVFLNMIFEQRNIHRFHKNMVSLLCVYACVVLNVNSSQKKTHKLHNHMVSLQYVFECVAPNMNCQQRKSHRFHMNTVFLQCVYAYVVLSVNFSQKKTHTLYKYMVFPQYVYEYVVPNFHFD